MKRGVHVGAGVFGQCPCVGVVTLGAGAHVFIGDAELGLAGESGEIGGEPVGEVDDLGKRKGFRFIRQGFGRKTDARGGSGGRDEERTTVEVSGNGFLAASGERVSNISERTQEWGIT